MQVRRLHPLFMGEVTGVDCGSLSPEQVKQVQRAIDRLAVLVFRNQETLDDAGQVAFSSHFGPLQRSITVHRQDTTRRLDHDALSDISNVDEEGRPLPETHTKRLLQRPARLWHTDSSFRDPPGRYTFLAARILPPEGGNTEFADMRAAYDALDPAMKARVEGLQVFHTLARSRSLSDAPPLGELEQRNMPGAVQGLVRTHPGSRRKALYLASHAESIVGWAPAEGRALLDELMQFATQARFVYSHAWKPGDLVMWDNRCTMHRATPFRWDLYRRDLRRTTVADGEPAGESRLTEAGPTPVATLL